METIRTVTVTRYMQPLREGGSLPALAEADDDFKYVIKFKGGGHGVKTLIAELIGGEIARALGLKVPELVFAELDECFGRSEGDEEIQDLLKASQGINLGLHFLSGAFTYDPVVNKIDPLLASKIVWLDSLITNVDRSFRNTNMLMWHKELWLIDHGSCLYFQYTWEGWEKKAVSPFLYIKDHVLLPQATQMEEADRICRELITENKIREIVQMIPDEWLQWELQDETPEQLRTVYFTFLSNRLNYSNQFIQTAKDAAETSI
ncbi:MAG: hypothetical protein K0M40_18795 [Prolixibacteraceae bacterium]|nr:hypothetical protein [Prolixibacteraceae bacterium]